MSKSEKNYCPTKKQLLAVIFALKKFEQYVSGRRFTLETDHKALVFLFTQKHVNRMISEWFETLLSFNFEIVHVPGANNVMADATSRMNEPVTLVTLTIEHLIRDKRQPEEGERRSLIQRAHEFGHFGQQEVFLKLWNKNYWWKNMRQEIADALADCMPCQRYNVRKRGFHPMQSITAELPWDHIAVDLVTPLPMTKSGEDTLLVITDIMTKFAVLRSLKGKGMAGITRSLWEVMSLFDIPKIIQSDNGVEFVNQLMEELTKLNGINPRTISAYNPRANGVVERTNGVIETMLKKELQGTMHEWSDYIPYVNLAYNAKISAATGSTPFSLMFGRKLNEFDKFESVAAEGPNKFVRWKKRLEKLSETIYPTVNELVLSKKGQNDQGLREKKQHCR